MEEQDHSKVKVGSPNLSGGANIPLAKRIKQLNPNEQIGGSIPSRDAKWRIRLAVKSSPFQGEEHQFKSGMRY